MSPGNTAIISVDGQEISYEQMWALVQALVMQLAIPNEAQGSRIGIYLPKHLLSALVPFAVSLCGSVFVPLNPLLKADQLEHIINDAEMEVLITTPERASRLENMLQRTNLKRLFLTTAPKSDLEITFDYQVWKPDQRFSADIPRPAMRPPGTVAAILYTSGSTGKAKGVVLSHANLIVGAGSVNEYLRINERDNILSVLPFSFDYGLNQLISSIAAGATCVLCDYLLPGDIVKAVEKHSITGLAGVPTLWALLGEAKWPLKSGLSIRYFTNSGGRMPSSVLAKLRRILPNAEPILMYGLTEAFRSTYLPVEEIERRPDSIGIPIPNAKITLVSDSGEKIEGEGQGELVHSGPLVALGYWRRPEETNRVFRTIGQPGSDLPTERAVWSGDIVYRDKQGFFYFIGRRDAMIKTSGYRVSPEEVEEVLYATGMVAMAAVFGVEDDVLGQAIIAAIVLKPESNGKSADDAARVSLIKEKCRAKLPNYLAIREVVVCKDLPRNANGKIDRIRLSKEYTLKDEPGN